MCFGFKEDEFNNLVVIPNWLVSSYLITLLKVNTFFITLNVLLFEMFIVVIFILLQYILHSRLIAKHPFSGPCLLPLVCDMSWSWIWLLIQFKKIPLILIICASDCRLQLNRSDLLRWSMIRTMRILRIKWNRYEKLSSIRVKLWLKSSDNPSDDHICS